MANAFRSIRGSRGSRDSGGGAVKSVGSSASRASGSKSISNKNQTAPKSTVGQPKVKAHLALSQSNVSSSQGQVTVGEAMAAGTKPTSSGISDSTLTSPPLSPSSGAFSNIAAVVDEHDASLQCFQVRVTVVALTGISAEHKSPVSAPPVHMKRTGSKATQADASSSSVAPTANSEIATPPPVSAFASLSREDQLPLPSIDAAPAIVRSLPLKEGVSTRHTAVWVKRKKALHPRPPQPQKPSENGSSGGTESNKDDTTLAAAAQPSPQPFLYLSAMLKPEDGESQAGGISGPYSPLGGASEDGAGSRGVISPSPSVAIPFAPEIVNLHVGVVRGADESAVNLGIATFVVSGQEIKGQRMDLPIRPVEQPRPRTPVDTDPFAPKRTGSLPDELIAKKKKGGMRGLFGASKRLGNREAPSSSVVARPPNPGSFADDPRKFGLAPNAILRIHLEVTGGGATDLTTSQSASFWEKNAAPGAVIDDDSSSSSRGAITVYDLNSEQGMASALESNIPLGLDPFASESIEVMGGTSGTTVISSPGGTMVGAVIHHAEGDDKASSSSANKAAHPLDSEDTESAYTSFVIKNVETTGTPDINTNNNGPNQVKATPKPQQSVRNTILNKLMCGGPGYVEDDLTYNRGMDENFSFESTLPDYENVSITSPTNRGGDVGNSNNNNNNTGPNKRPTTRSKANSSEGTTEEVSQGRKHSSQPKNAKNDPMETSVASTAGNGTKLNATSTEEDDTRNDNEEEDNSHDDNTFETDRDHGHRRRDRRGRGGGRMKSTSRDTEEGSEEDDDDDDEEDDSTYAVNSVGEDTLRSLNNAKETLRRYANRVGLDVEDLLEANGTVDTGRNTDFDDDETMTYDSGTIGSGTIESGTIGTVEDSTVRTYDDVSTLETPSLGPIRRGWRR